MITGRIVILIPLFKECNIVYLESNIIQLEFNNIGTTYVPLTQDSQL